MTHPEHFPYYRVDLSPEAWQEVGRVGAGDFLVLQGVMELLAMQGTPYEEGEGPYALSVAGFEMLYTRDEEEHIVTLHHVIRVPEYSAEGI